MKKHEFKNELFGFGKKKQTQDDKIDLKNSEAHLISVVNYNKNNIKLTVKTTEDTIAIFADVTLTNMLQTILPKISYLITYDVKENTIDINRSIENVNFINSTPKTLTSFDKIHSSEELYKEINSVVKNDILNLLKKIEKKGFFIKPQRLSDTKNSKTENDFNLIKLENDIIKSVNYKNKKLSIRSSVSVDNIGCFCDLEFQNNGVKISPTISYLLVFNDNKKSINITRSIENVDFINSKLKYLVNNYLVEDDKDILKALNTTIVNDLHELITKIESKGFIMA